MKPVVCAICAVMFCGVRPVNGQSPDDRPMVLFIGDSITANSAKIGAGYTPSQPVPSPRLIAGSYGYVEALYEATRVRGPYRYDRLGSGGQAITGWIGTTVRQVLEKRYRGVTDPPAILVIQDYIGVDPSPTTAPEPTPRSPNAPRTTRGGLAKALRAIVASAAKSPKTRLIFSTPACDPTGAMARATPQENFIAATDVMLAVGAEAKVPVIRLDIAWQRYAEFVKDKTPIPQWRLTGEKGYWDGVHPNRVGAYFQALVFARELGIAADQFDETTPLGLSAAQAAEIKGLVYSWTEPTAIAPQVKTPASQSDAGLSQ